MANKAHVEAQKRYNEKTGYNKANLKSVLVSFHVTNEADIFEFLNKQKNKSGFIKDLIRAEMMNQS